MTTLEIILLVLLYIITCIFLIAKWTKAINDSENVSFAILGTMFFCPIVLIIAIIRQVFIEDWR